MSGRSTTGSKTACAPTSSSACSPIISNGTCASAWPSCSTTTPTRRPPRRSARARSQRLSDRPPPSPSRPQAEPTMVSPSTASTPCFTTSPPSPKTPSRPPSRPTSPSQSPHGRHTSRKKPSTSWASPVPSNTPIQLDLIKLEQWVAQVERGKLRLIANGRGQRLQSLPQLGGELLDLLARLFELLQRSRVRDAEVRAQAEGAAVHNGDALLLQKRSDKILVGLDHGARRR